MGIKQISKHQEQEETNVCDYEAVVKTSSIGREWLVVMGLGGWKLALCDIFGVVWDAVKTEKLKRG